MSKTSNNGPRELSARKARATSSPIWACPTPTSGWPGRSWAFTSISCLPTKGSRNGKLPPC